jgi:nucleoside-diphosphate-sugar epimerase
MAAAHHVLLLGGSGKVAQLLTPMLLQRSWTVTSIIRNPDQVTNLQKLGENQGGKLNVLVRSLEEVKSDDQAKSLIDEVKPDYVVFSAGAGGKGPPERVGFKHSSRQLIIPPPRRLLKRMDGMR